MPKNRPGFTVVYIPEKQQVKQNTNELNRAVVIDAKLRPNHMTLIIQSVLMLNCQLEYPYVVTHMSEAQYLLLLPVGVDHLQFLKKFGEPLQQIAINGYPTRLKYKVWIELGRMTPQAWCIEHLIVAISSFGIILDHTPMAQVNSLE